MLNQVLRPKSKSITEKIATSTVGVTATTLKSATKRPCRWAPGQSLFAPEPEQRQAAKDQRAQAQQQDKVGDQQQQHGLGFGRDRQVAGHDAEGGRPRGQAEDHEDHGKTALQLGALGPACEALQQAPGLQARCFNRHDRSRSVR